jgi:DNA-binding transcriptional ArsR family regulator
MTKSASLPGAIEPRRAMIGVTRQTLSNLLSRLEQRGLTDVKFRRIRVVA